MDFAEERPMPEPMRDIARGRLSRYAWMLATGWTLLLAGLLAWGLHGYSVSAIEEAKIQARSSIEKDIIARRWNAMRGGVYVRANELTPPNPFLADNPHRDIITPDGQALTLVNPAYMTRQIHELQRRSSQIVGHTTSLKPLNPANGADAWEAAALHAFEQGQTEVSSMEQFEGSPHLRLIRPLVTEQACLSCHAAQGYKVGDVRGGLGVAIPMAPIWEATTVQRWLSATRYGILWLIGVAGLAIVHRGIDRLVVELNQAQKAAEAASNAKSNFLANMTHELRTPLGAILGYAELQADPNTSPEDRQEHFHTIQRSGEYLLTLINDVLDLASVEAGQFSVEAVDCSIRDHAEQIVDLLRLRAQEKKLRLTLNCDDDVPAIVHCDPRRLRQILVNLVGNAIKFTPSGSVSVRIARENTANGPMILWQVSDTGIGIEASVLPRLFQPFSQGDSSTAREFGGTGLGLALSQRLAGLMGGHIHVISTPGEGSTFTLALPCR